jgi:excisionase family DNA binding protein
MPKLTRAELKRRLSEQRKQASKPTVAVPAESDVLTVEEAAIRLRIGRNTAYEACRQGTIPAIHIGDRWLIPRAALERMLRGETLDAAE